MYGAMGETARARVLQGRAARGAVGGAPPASAAASHATTFGESGQIGGQLLDATPFLCNGGKYRLCVLDGHYAGDMHRR